MAAIFFIPMYILYGIIAIPLILIGYIMVPIAILFGAYTPYMGRDGAGTPRIQYKFTWPIMFIWNNHEDGIADQTYSQSALFNTMFWKIFYWSCIRNPVNNLRITPVVSVKINPNAVRFVGSFGSSKDLVSRTNVEHYDSNDHNFWYFAWQGVYSNIRWQFQTKSGARWRIWLGWKIYPHDMYGIKETDYRFKGAGYASQIKNISK